MPLVGRRLRLARQVFTVQPMKKQSGFTLLELMITVALAAIILALGVPNMRDFLMNNRTASMTNEFVGALSFARGEAISRGQQVEFCRLQSGTNDQCAASGADWSVGWLARNFATGQALRVWNEIDADIELNMLVSPDNCTSLLFASDGSVRSPASADSTCAGYINVDDTAIIDLSTTCDGAGSFAFCFSFRPDAGSDAARCRAGRRLDLREISISHSGRVISRSPDCA